MNSLTKIKYIDNKEMPCFALVNNTLSHQPQIYFTNGLHHHHLVI